MAGIRKLKTMESFAVKSQPFPVGLIVGHHIFDQLPKPLSVVHFLKMRDLMGGDIIQNGDRSHDQPPRIHQPSI